MTVSRPSWRLKKFLVQAPVLAYPARDGPFVLYTDASDTGMRDVLEQEQEEDDSLVKVIAYESKTLNASQQWHYTANKDLLAVVTAMEPFKYYLTGRHFMVVTDHASHTWLQNIKEPDFKIADRPGKHHSHLALIVCYMGLK